MSCVLPQPAGAVIAPRSIASRSNATSLIVDPTEDALDDGGEALFPVLVTGRDDRAPDVFHRAHVLEPRRCLGRTGFDQRASDLSGDPRAATLQRKGVTGYRLDVVI